MPPKTAAASLLAVAALGVAGVGSAVMKDKADKAECDHAPVCAGRCIAPAPAPLAVKLGLDGTFKAPELPPGASQVTERVALDAKYATVEQVADGEVALLVRPVIRADYVAADGSPLGFANLRFTGSAQLVRPDYVADALRRCDGYEVERMEPCPRRVEWEGLSDLLAGHAAETSPRETDPR